jgi:diacylglycerol O-acyltransferase / wax synthase
MTTNPATAITMTLITTPASSSPTPISNPSAAAMTRRLARTGLLRWFINRQRRIHTFVTNVRGPDEPLTLAGAPGRAVIAIGNAVGNVTVAFGALSYAGTLRITVVSDPSRVPDVAVLTAALRRDPGAAAH